MRRFVAGLLCVGLVAGLAGCTKTAEKTDEIKTEEVEIGYITEEDYIGSGIISTSEQYGGEALAALDRYNGETVLKDAELSEKALKFYTGKQKDDGTFESIDTKAYFVDESQSVPYLRLDDLVNVYNVIFMEIDPEREIVGAKGDNGYTMTRHDENSQITFDFTSNKIIMKGYDYFISKPNSASPSDFVESGSTEEGSFIQHMSTKFINGNDLEVDLNEYGIHLVEKDGEYYCPLTTFSDLFVAHTYSSFAYNTQDLFVIPYGSLTDATGARSAYGELYYNIAGPGERSDELIAYNYAELCLAMDFLYGLKDEHDISTFSEYAYRTELLGALLSKDPTEYFEGLMALNYVHLADKHSAMKFASVYCADQNEATLFNSDEELSAYYKDIVTPGYEAKSARYDSTGSSDPSGYTEVGDTAFITFDSFRMDAQKDYKAGELVNDPSDTVMLVLYAHSQITREDSPVKNVVLNLSNNSGGTFDAASIVVSWFVGSYSSFSIKNMTTQAGGSTRYRFDADRDGVYTAEKDVLTNRGYNLYCVTSNKSFSCGNLTAAALKSTGKVTILGRQSGGGTCIVQPIILADGTGMQISGPNRISVTKNGTFYSVDDGVEPDVYISEFKNCFNNEYLAEVIHDLQ